VSPDQNIHPLRNAVHVSNESHGLQPEAAQAASAEAQGSTASGMSVSAQWDATRERLASLPRLEYEKVRKQEAKTWGIRPSMLDEAVEEVRLGKACGDSAGEFGDLEPWPEPVLPALVLDQVLATIKMFVVCGDDAAVLATLWIAFTWFIDYSEVAPIAIITSPRPRCGKTTLLGLIAKLSRRPLLASNLTGAAIFQAVDAFQPTLLIDETDSFLKKDGSIRGVINSGHTRATGFILRAGKKDGIPKKFSTYCAKLLCGIGKQAETIMDRAVVIKLRRKLKEEKVQRLRQAEREHFTALARKLARLAADHGSAIRSARPQIPDELNDRAQDNWEPLLAIAELAGEEWAQMARDAAVPAPEDEEESDISVMLLADIRRVFAQVRTEIIGGRPVKRIQTEQLLKALAADDSRPWATINHGSHMTSLQLAEHLKPFGIRSANDKWPGGKVPKGYRLEKFDDAFRRYLPAVAPTVADLDQESLNDPSSIRYLATNQYPCGFEEDDPVAVADEGETLEDDREDVGDSDVPATSDL